MTRLQRERVVFGIVQAAGYAAVMLIIIAFFSFVQ